LPTTASGWWDRLGHRGGCARRATRLVTRRHYRVDLALGGSIPWIGDGGSARLRGRERRRDEALDPGEKAFEWISIQCGISPYAAVRPGFLHAPGPFVTEPTFRVEGAGGPGRTVPGSLAAHIDLNLAWLGFLARGQPYGEHAILVLGRDPNGQWP
jgi:hypothetical protein